VREGGRGGQPVRARMRREGAVRGVRTARAPHLVCLLAVPAPGEDKVTLEAGGHTQQIRDQHGRQVAVSVQVVGRHRKLSARWAARRRVLLQGKAPRRLASANPQPAPLCGGLSCCSYARCAPHATASSAASHAQASSRASLAAAAPPPASLRTRLGSRAAPPSPPRAPPPPSPSPSLPPPSPPAVLPLLLPPPPPLPPALPPPA